MLRGFEERMDFLSLENESIITPRRVVRVLPSEKRVTEKALALDDVAIISFTRSPDAIISRLLRKRGNRRQGRGVAGVTVTKTIMKPVEGLKSLA